MKITSLGKAGVATLACLLPFSVYAQLSVTENFNGTTTTNTWNSYGGACMTAGTYSSSASTTLIPGCKNLPYYGTTTLVGGATGTLPDTSGLGALRLTNGDTTTGNNGNNQTGAIVYTTPFPTNQGIQISFNTVTYGGNAYSNGSGFPSGADGITFFLTDSSVPFSLGSYGGALGYSCSANKTPSDGMAGAYIGVGIDEYGNFANAGDNANSNDPNSLGSSPNTISIRGSGNITATSVAALSPTPSGSVTSVASICQNGYYSNTPVTTTTGSGRHSTTTTTYTNTSVQDYPLIASSVLPSNIAIYNQEAQTTSLRGSANPITYSLSITNDGLLSLSYNYNGGVSTPVISNQSIITSNGPLPANFLFGFSSGTGGGSNVHEITCFKAGQISTTTSSAAGNANPDSKVQTNSQIFLSSYNANYWSGSLTATNLTANADGSVSVAAHPSWDASCVLTGGACTNPSGSSTATTPTSRVILTWSGTAGIPFEWTNLTSTQKTAIDSTASSSNASSSTRMDYLRGVRTNEITTTGTGLYRVRKSVLGDIMGSSPAWVGPPSSSYGGTWKDLLYPTVTMPEAGTASYTSFISTNATRQNVVYAGANDGMVHGFKAGAYNSDGTISLTSSTGAEVLAYVPSLSLNTLHSSTASLDLSSTQYAHNAFVDATPGSGDLYYNGAWHTWLVGGLGAGGNATGVIGTTSGTAIGGIYALDITTPTSSNFAESNAATIVIGDWNSNNITCVGNTTCGTHLGSTYGTPIIRRLHDGNWGVIFGNGLNSSSGTAGIFVMIVNSGTGATTFYYLDTGAGAASSGAKNGIAYVTSADLDGDHITDYVYAGDVLGNLWRFDLTSKTESSWAAASSAMFTATTSTTVKPITTSVKISSVPTTGNYPRIIVNFGTGQQLPQTLTSAATYAGGTQSLFGVWDWNMASWNGKSSVKYYALTSPQTNSTSATYLTTQTLTSSTYTNSSGIATNSYLGTNNTVCWSGSSTCASGTNTKFGWTINLPTSTEQVTFNPTLLSGVFFVNTNIPAVTQILSCTTTPASGYSIAVNLATGGTDSVYTTVTGSSSTVGIGQGATGTAYFVTGTKSNSATTTTGATGSTITTSIDQSSNGAITNQVNLPTPNNTGSRLTWLQLR